MLWSITVGGLRLYHRIGRTHAQIHADGGLREKKWNRGGTQWRRKEQGKSTRTTTIRKRRDVQSHGVAAHGVNTECSLSGSR